MHIQKHVYVCVYEGIHIAICLLLYTTLILMYFRGLEMEDFHFPFVQSCYIYIFTSIYYPSNKNRKKDSSKVTKIWLQTQKQNVCNFLSVSVHLILLYENSGRRFSCMLGYWKTYFACILGMWCY